MENNEEVKAENPTTDIQEEIEKLKAEKEAILEAQANQSKQLEEISALKAEIEELKKYTFPQEVKPLTQLEQIEQKYNRVLRAIDENFPVGHQERLLPREGSYNGVNYLEGFARYVEGEKLEDIFKDPLE